LFRFFLDGKMVAQASACGFSLNGFIQMRGMEMTWILTFGHAARAASVEYRKSAAWCAYPPSRRNIC
jgi:hypothetical protein